MVLGLKKAISFIGIFAALVAGQARNNTRIIGGESSSEGDYPFVGFMIQRSGSFCGASLISNIWLVTAAHCVNGARPADIQVTLGNLEFSTNSGRSVSRIVIHSNYDPRTESNDIAVIQLANSVNFGTVKIDRDDVGDDETVRALGWGLTSATGGGPASTLQQVDLKTMSRQECQKRLPSFRGNGVDGQLCTGNTPGKDTCSGDSGGPLLRTRNGDTKLVGITSFGAWDSRMNLEKVCGIE
ncbi:Mite allergen Der p 3, partial [Smittium culicis]